MKASDEQRAAGDVRRFSQRLARANRDRAVYQIAIGRRVLRGFITPARAAQICGVSPRTIRRWTLKAAEADASALSAAVAREETRRSLRGAAAPTRLQVGRRTLASPERGAS